MPNITIPSYFTSGETKIPNAVSGNAGEGINVDLQSIINKYEKELLISILGLSQYNELQSELVKEPFVTGAPQMAAAKWVSFVNDSNIKDLLGLYIYCKWLRFDEINLTTTGAGKSDVQNHTVTDYNQKYVERWNEFVFGCLVSDTSLYYFMESREGLSTDYFQEFEYENSFGL